MALYRQFFERFVFIFGCRRSLEAHLRDADKGDDFKTLAVVNPVSQIELAYPLPCGFAFWEHAAGVCHVRVCPVESSVEAH